jgi:hypothetical protein
MFFGVYCVKILFISLSQRLKNSDAVIIALSMAVCLSTNKNELNTATAAVYA